MPLHSLMGCFRGAFNQCDSRVYALSLTILYWLWCLCVKICYGRCLFLLVARGHSGLQVEALGFGGGSQGSNGSGRPGFVCGLGLRLVYGLGSYFALG